MADELKQTLYWAGAPESGETGDGTLTTMSAAESHDANDSTRTMDDLAWVEPPQTSEFYHRMACDSCTVTGTISFVRIKLRARIVDNGLTVFALYASTSGTGAQTGVELTISTSWNDYQDDLAFSSGSTPWVASTINGSKWGFNGSLETDTDGHGSMLISECYVEVWGPEPIVATPSILHLVGSVQTPALDGAVAITPTALHLVGSPQTPALDGAVAITTMALHLIGSVPSPAAAPEWVVVAKLSVGETIGTPMAWSSRTPAALHLAGAAKTPSIVPEGALMSPSASRLRVAHWGAAAIGGPGQAGVPHRLRISGEVQSLPVAAKHTAYSGAVESHGVTSAILHALIYDGTDTRIGDESLSSYWGFVQILADSEMTNGYGGLDTGWFGFETMPDDGNTITSVQLNAAIWLYCNDPDAPVTPPTYPGFLNQLEFRVETMGTTTTHTPELPMHHVHPSVGTPVWQPSLIRSTAVMTTQPNGSPWTLAAVNDIQARMIQFADQVPGDPDGRFVWMVVAEAWLEVAGVEMIIQDSQDVYEAVDVTTQHYSIISPRVATHEVVVVRVGEAH